MINPVDLIVSTTSNYDEIKPLEKSPVFDGPCEVTITFNGETYRKYMLSSVFIHEAEKLEL